jgi:pSer/pThr/pTyr-binding forkhead associated (FHA) protein
MEFGKLTATTQGRTLRVDVRPGSPVTVGRSTQCTLCVPDPKVSREHCRVEFVAGKLRVTDLASSHGLTYRGIKCAEFEIDVGDGFHVGQTFMRFEARATGPDEAPPVEARREVPAEQPPDDIVTIPEDVADEPDEPDELDEPDEREVAAQPAPVPEDGEDRAEQYPNVAGSGRLVRRRAARGGGFALRLFGQLCLIVTVVITTIAVILAAKNHNPEWDVYKLLELLRPPK